MAKNSPGMRVFLYPTIAGVVGLIAVLLSSGISAFFTALLLVLLEVTLSFDNAVVNAKVLKGMSAVWQQRFLTWGIALAVVGTRVVLPILIVSAVAMLSPVAVAYIAFADSAAYAELLQHSHHAIAAFGAAFLLMVSLKFFFDVEKELHWIDVIEKQLSKWGNIEAVEAALVLVFLLIVSAIVPHESATVLAAGAIGIVVFILMEGITSTMSAGASRMAHGGFAAFMYLNTLDTAFSLDGVVGAFAITTDLLTIAVGLGIGAYFVRSMTVYLVREGTMSTLPYLEHGAHWAIFGLGSAMALSLITPIPEAVTAGIGLIFIGASYISSIRERTLVQKLS
jgi:hypothetical protein